MPIQLSNCCKAEIRLTSKDRPNAFDCPECGRIIGTPITNSPQEISFCNSCFCMTKTIDSKCGKCQGSKPTNQLLKSNELVDNSPQHVPHVYHTCNNGTRSPQASTVEEIKSEFLQKFIHIDGWEDVLEFLEKSFQDLTATVRAEERKELLRAANQLDEKNMTPIPGTARMIKNPIAYSFLIEIFRLSSELSHPTVVTSKESDKITRVEVIDETGRVYTRNDAKVDHQLQDDGRTLKVLIEEKK